MMQEGTSLRRNDRQERQRASSRARRGEDQDAITNNMAAILMLTFRGNRQGEFHLSVLLFNSLTTVSETPPIAHCPKAATRAGAAPLFILSATMFFFHGYHPNSQDSAIYTSSAERVIDPSLFHIDAGFVDGHTRLSVFSHLVAGIAMVLHSPLSVVQLLCYWFTGLLFLYACRRMAIRVFVADVSVWSATVLAGVCSTMPVAATSLLLMDPYLTARSFSTPFSMLALVSCMDRSWKWGILWAGLALLFHPLMGIYLCFLLLVLILVDERRFGPAFGILGLVFLSCGVLSLFSRHSPISDAYRTAALSRSYYFLSCWKWHELLGIAAPLVLMAIVAVRSGISSNARNLSAACALTGFTSSLISICFVSTSHPDFLMRVQVLRSFHMIYAVGLVLLGGYIGMLILRSRLSLALLLIPVAAMGIADWQSYASTARIEWPWQRTGNPREEAYRWIADNTPSNAVFASDTATGHDSEAEGFRSITRRSTLNDAKDEGIASLFPPLAPQWAQWSDAEYGLNHLTDEQRKNRLRPFGVTWILLSPESKTSFPCPYRNAQIAVCRITP